MNKNSKDEIDPGTFVDQLYDIALDPESLHLFIDAWNDAGLDGQEARQAIKSFDQFDLSYQAHLKRAETFLALGRQAGAAPDLAATLKPFDSLAAFIVDDSQTVVASNSGAQAAFGFRDGGALADIRWPREAREILMENVAQMFLRTDSRDSLLKVDAPDQRGPALFQMRLLPSTPAHPVNHVLIVTTQYHWQPALDGTLEEVFALTSAERGVVRALVEGLDAKAIAADRGTSQGTVRGQIKSVLAKMNAHTQSEVIRLVLSLRGLSETVDPKADQGVNLPVLRSADWLQGEVWKPFQFLTLQDGRRLFYHDMGPVTGAPVLYSHMGYCMARWHRPMIRLAFQHGLRVICPIRAGYGQSDNLHPKADVLQATRADTLALLDHLEVARLPYVTQGNDLIFAADLAAHFPEKVSEIIGICARPSLPGDRHYSGMGKWHRFFLSTAKHAPHLLKFTAKAAVTLAKRNGVTEMYRQMNQRSAADMALIGDRELKQVLVANAELIAGKDTDVAQAYAMEILATEAQWSDLMLRCKDIRTWFVNGAEDPATDIATIAEYRETYPWIDIEVIQNAGQMLLYQHYEKLIPRIAEAARASATPPGA